jgi:diadenosine tetraphosphatase ApaH/serine/threonine PP2A family protein phosphatase
MRYLVLTDIHANLEAMEACLADATSRGYDRALVLGDLVGYCADANAVVERVQSLEPVAMVRKWLADLPRGPIVVDELVEICHGSPFDEDAYIFDELDAVRALKTSERPLCLFGHTHWPVMFELAEGQVDTIGSAESSAGLTVLRPGSKYLVNPGSVGQPRDGDPRAAYGLVDTIAKSVELFRVDYPIEIAQAKVMKAGLPEVLAQRLAAGR